MSTFCLSSIVEQSTPENRVHSKTHASPTSSWLPKWSLFGRTHRRTSSAPVYKAWESEEDPYFSLIYHEEQKRVSSAGKLSAGTTSTAATENYRDFRMAPRVTSVASCPLLGGLTPASCLPSKALFFNSALGNSVDSFGNISPTSTTGRTPRATLKPEVVCPTHLGDKRVYDDYEFFGSIGHGSFGEVMIVRQKLTRQLRACKVVTVCTQEQLHLVRTEIELLKTLDHPNILKLHEAYFEKAAQSGATKIYLVTELCEGGDMKSRIAHHYEELKQPMTESHVAFMMQQILSALKCCHAHGIVHRDIKPENILFVDLSPYSPVKIIDFGLADFIHRLRDRAVEVQVPREDIMGRFVRAFPRIHKQPSRLRYSSKLMMQRAGTAPYMAPELDQGVYDETADMFSVGIIACQMLTGQHPFHALKSDNRKTIRLKITAPFPVDLPPEGFKHVSEEAQQLCRGLLQKCPKKRLTAVQALEHPWFEAITWQTLPYGGLPIAPLASCSFSNQSVLQALCEYQASHKLKRAVLQLLAAELPEDQIKNLRNQFMALDTNSDGHLSIKELVSGLHHSDGAAGREEPEESIAYTEFIAALAWQQVDFNQEHLLACFQKLDQNGSGSIGYIDMCLALQGDCSNEPGLSESEWEEITMSAGSGGLHERLEVTFERLVALIEA